VELPVQTLTLPVTERSSTYKWCVVAMLWFVCFFNYADRQAIFSVFPILKAEMKLSDVQLGIVGGAFMWVYAAIGPLAGLVGDRLRRKTLIVGGLIFWSLITIATALSTKYWHLVVFRAIEGFGEAFYFPAAMSLISDYHGRGTRSKAMGICQSSVYAGTIAGGTVAGFLGQYHGWRSGFYLFGSLGVLLGFVLVTLLKEPARGQAESDDQTQADEATGGHTPARTARNAAGREPIGSVLASIFANPMVLVLITVFVGANFVAAIFLTWMPSFLTRKFAMSLSMAGLNGTAWLQLASVAGVLTGGFLADRLARRSRAGRMFTQAIGLALGIPFIFLTGYTLSATVLVLAMVGFGYFKGLYDANIWAALYDVVPPARRATALGFMNSIGWLGGGIAPVAIAAASQHYGMSACLSGTSVIYGLAAIVYLFGIRAFLRRTVTQPAMHGLDATEVVRP
jgi:MFS family permease